MSDAARRLLLSRWLARLPAARQAVRAGGGRVRDGRARWEGEMGGRDGREIFLAHVFMAPYYGTREKRAPSVGIRPQKVARDSNPDRLFRQLIRPAGWPANQGKVSAYRSSFARLDGLPARAIRLSCSAGPHAAP